MILRASDEHQAQRRAPAACAQRFAVSLSLFSKVDDVATYLITGGAGFIGSALIRQIIDDTEHRVIDVDCLTYAGNLESLAHAAEHPRHVFQRVDICDAPALRHVFEQHQPDAVLHLAAE